MTKVSIDWDRSLVDSNSSVSFAELQAREPAATQQFLIHLAQMGFSKVRLEAGPLLDALSAGAQAGRGMGSFRFPPVDAPVNYTAAHRGCFRGLYELSRTCLDWILAALNTQVEETEILRQCLREAEAGSKDLFAPAGQGHTPFSDSEVAFGSSFFNIFDYDHGLLNAHKDRYLITSIFAASKPETAHERSVLWVSGQSGTWHNVDAHLRDDEVVFMIGEELEAILQPLGLPLYAADHCIRVDPDGEFLSRAHFRRDPATPESGNRLSTAFILGEPRLG